MPADRFPLLPREGEVLVAAANGEKRAVTARRLGWTVSTVQHYRQRAIRALDGIDMPHAVALAFASGALRRADVNPDWRVRLADAPPVIQVLAASLGEGEHDG